MCTPQNPSCDDCPLAGECRALAEAKLVHKGKPVQYDMEDSDGICVHIFWLMREICGLCPPFEVSKMDREKWISTHYPRKSAKKAPHVQSKSKVVSHTDILDYVTAVISRKSDNGPEYFLVQRPDTGLLAGLWDFPNIAIEDPETDETSARETLLEYLASLGLTKVGKLVKKGTSLHIFTHIRRTSLVYTVGVNDPHEEAKDGRWVTEEDIVDMAVSELGRKVLRLALGTEKRKDWDRNGKAKAKSRKVPKLEKGQTT